MPSIVRRRTDQCTRLHKAAQRRTLPPPCALVARSLALKPYQVRLIRRRGLVLPMSVSVGANVHVSIGVGGGVVGWVEWRCVSKRPLTARVAHELSVRGRVDAASHEDMRIGCQATSTDPRSDPIHDYEASRSDPTNKRTRRLAWVRGARRVPCAAPCARSNSKPGKPFWLRLTHDKTERT
jgi:hypothetical protein